MTPSAISNCLAHQAFLYGSPEQFVASMAPFARAGLERGDSVCAATKRTNVDALREELGDDAERIVFHDTTAWQTRPYDRLQEFGRLVDELPQGGGLTAMGEPLWQGSDAERRQWARYESIINLTLADAPMRFVCLYDSAGLPDSILEYATQTHPEQVADGRVVACRDYVPPEAFLPGDASVLPQTATELPLEGARLRRLVTSYALGAGLLRERTEELVLAANEIASNAIVHGRPPVRAHVWTQHDEIVFRIVDSGAGIADPLVGWLPPHGGAGGGWGLSIARKLCDVVEVAPSSAGTAVSLHMSLPVRTDLDTADQAA